MHPSAEQSVAIEVIKNGDDIAACFDILCETFGRQTGDGYFSALHPDWQTSKGQVDGAGRMRLRLAQTTTDRNGDLNTMFLKATLSEPDSLTQKKIVGFAIWEQMSNVPGHGVPPHEDLSKIMNLEAIYPNQPMEQRYLCQLDLSFRRRRIELAKEIASTATPAVMLLDICCVHPDYQRRGIASQLVRWGLREAARRGGLEAILEASVAGRVGYARLGFRQEGEEIQWIVDDEFQHRDRPSVVFMRTGAALCNE